MLPAYQEFSPEQFRDLLAGRDSVVLVDVRDGYEFDAGHISGAHLYPWNSGLFTAKHTELPAGFSIALYCRTGNRSSKAAAILDTAAGGKYSGRVCNLTTGISEWPFEVVTGGQDGPELAAADTVRFPDALAGARSRTGRLTLHNHSAQGAAVLRITTGGGVFSAPDSSLVIPPGGSIQAPLAFRPETAGVFEGLARIAHGGIERDTLTVVLAGTGVLELPGDFNSSGRADVFDLLELLKAISGKLSLEQPVKYDLNSDGKVDIFDLLALLHIMREES